MFNYTYTWSGLLEYPKNTAKTDFYPIYGIWEIGEIEGYETAYSVELNGRGSYPFDANGQIVISATEIPLEATVTYSDRAGTEQINKSVAVTITANRAIKDIEGWTRVSDSSLEKVYSDNGSYQVTIEDTKGNTLEVAYEVKGIEKVTPTAVFSQDITEWTQQNVTVTMTASIDCETPEGWTKVDAKTFTKIFENNGSYNVTLTSIAGAVNDQLTVEIKNIDREAPAIQYDAIGAAGGYNRTLEVNEGAEYSYEELVSMFTRPEWVQDNSGTAVFTVDTWGVENGLDGYAPFNSKEPGSYKLRFYAIDAAGNTSTFDVFVTVARKILIEFEPKQEEPETAVEPQKAPEQEEPETAVEPQKAPEQEEPETVVEPQKAPEQEEPETAVEPQKAPEQEEPETAVEPQKAPEQEELKTAQSFQKEK